MAQVAGSGTTEERTSSVRLLKGVKVRPAKFTSRVVRVNDISDALKPTSVLDGSTVTLLIVSGPETIEN